MYLNFEAQKFTETPTDAEYPVTIVGPHNQSVSTKYVLTCGGLQSDLLAKLTGCSPVPKIVPFRGEYLLLNPDKAYLVRGNIYPVPDPRFPFLGVHFTPRMDGSVWLGPNAVLAFKREGYKYSDINVRELIDAVQYPGLIKLGFKYMGAGMSEILKSAIIPLQMMELRKFIPSILDSDVTRGPAGVRAQAINEDGSLEDDFIFDKGSEGTSSIAQRVLHCRNAPSPGATSSLAIAKMIADRIKTEFAI